MKPVSPPVRALAHRIAERQLATAVTSDDLVAAADDLCRRLDELLAQLIGRMGLQALVNRALHKSRLAHPWLSGIEIDLGRSPRVVFCTEVIGSQGQDAFRAAITDFLERILGLLESFIGPDLTLRALQQGWPAGDAAEEQ